MSGSIDAFASWNKNKQAAKVRRWRFFQSVERRVLDGVVARSSSGAQHDRPKWASAARIRMTATSAGIARSAVAKNMDRFERTYPTEAYGRDSWSEKSALAPLQHQGDENDQESW
jgi:hypothetical protein